MNIESSRDGRCVIITPSSKEELWNNSATGGNVRNEPNTTPPTKRPAVGIIPEKLWKEQRLSELKVTIRRRLKNGDILLHTWIKEYNKLLRELRK